MGAKRIVAVKIRNKKWLRFILLAALAAALVFFVNERKDFIVGEMRRSLEALLSRESDFQVSIGKIGGRFLGEIRFQDVSVMSPGPFPESERVLFRAKEISVHYRLLDFLSKKFDSKISVVVKSPEVFWRPRVHLSRHRDFPFFGWMRQWALARRDTLDIRIQNMSLLFESQKFKLEGINFSYKDNKIKMETPIRHLNLGDMDVSTTVIAEGDFHLGFFGEEDLIEGEIYTEGTIVNWTPLPEESRFGFSFSRSAFHLTSSDFLGGIRVQGSVDFEHDYRVVWDIDAQNYQVKNLDFLLKAAPKTMLPSGVDLNLHFEGSPLAPSVQGRARIYNGHIGNKTFKAMDLNINGVYPTVRLENSRLLLQDESVMKFANKTLEFRELLRGKTYEGLIGEAQQDTVVWGDWEFRRPKDINDKSEFLLQRALGDRARLNFREYKRDQTVQSPEDSDKVEVGLEYKLADKNSLKLGLREDEKFVGVERKVKF